MWTIMKRSLISIIGMVLLVLPVGALWGALHPLAAGAESDNAFEQQAALPKMVSQIAVSAPVGVQTLYVVEAGDTLSAIASKFGVTVEEIQEANGIEDVNVLHVGQELKIPVSSSAEEVPVEETAEVLPTASTVVEPSQSSANESSLTRSLCAANSKAYQLALPSEPIRLIVADSRAYMIANGDLVYVALNTLGDQAEVAPVNVMPEGRRVGRYTIQEFVYVTVEEGTGDLILLDKTDDIYRFSIEKGWQVAFAAKQIPTQFPDQQFIALQAINGQIYALDSDLSHIWTLAPGDLLPSAYWIDDALLRGVDFAMMGAGVNKRPVVLTLTDGLFTVGSGQAVTLFAQPNATIYSVWPSQILATATGPAIVDGESRQVTGVDATSGQIGWTIDFRFPEMRRLRSVAMNEENIYGVAGPTLYVAKLSDLDNSCPAVSFDNSYYFDGLDLLAVMPIMQLPSPGEIPVRPRSYPGARRLYRYGVHEGLDYYSTESAGLWIGTPVEAMADGVIARIDSGYVEMTPGEYEAAIAETERLHETPPDLMDKLLGRQVHIQHNQYVETVYAHLSAVAPDLAVDSPVQQGQMVGNVGVSGTRSGAYGAQDDAHLHFGIMVNGHYLGQGLTLYETWRLWEVVFSFPRPQKPVIQSASPTPLPAATATVTPTLAPTVTPTVAARSRVPTVTPRAIVEPPTGPAVTPTMAATQANEGAVDSSQTGAVATVEAGTVACQRPPDDYTRVEINGETINARTLWMLQLADFLYDGPGNPLAVVQGSYTTDLAASFGTHDGGGVVDISIREKAHHEVVMSDEQAGVLVDALRQAGFAAWLRLPDDLSPPATLHIHAVAVGDAELSDAAQLQLDGPQGYFLGWDGVPPEQGGPKLDRYGGPVVCDWMKELGYADLSSR